MDRHSDFITDRNDEDGPDDLTSRVEQQQQEDDPPHEPEADGGERAREREREREEGGQGKHETGLNQKKKSRTSSLISLCRWIHHGAASPVRPTRHSSDGRGWHLRPPPFSDPRTDQSARAWRGRHSQRQSRN